MVYRFFADGTVQRYDIEPGNPITEENLYPSYSFTYRFSDGKLILTYTLSVRYGVDGAAEVTEKIYTFDAATGERLAE